MIYRLVDIPTFAEERGTLSVLELEQLVPFPVRRLFYVYDVPAEALRGGHALKECHQFMIVMAGQVTFELEGRDQKTALTLDRRDQGLYLPPPTWRELTAFSADACCLVLASDPYQPDGYHRDYEEWKSFMNSTPRE